MFVWLVVACGCPASESGGRRSRYDPRYPDEPTNPEGPIVIEGVGTDGRLRFDLPAVASSELVRLDLLVVPSGMEAEVAIRGLVDQGSLEGAAPTAAVVSWTVTSPDPYAGLPRVDERIGLDCAPLHRFTPDLSPLLAEATSRGATHASFVVQPIAGTFTLQERKEITDRACPGTLAQRLEVYPTVRSTFVAKELTAQVTDTSATLTLMSLVDVDIEVDLERRVIPATGEAGEVVVVALDGLPAHARTTYVVRVRKPGGDWEIGPEHAVHTRRAPGEPFTFTVTADGHFLNMEHRRAWSSMVLLGATMDRAASEQPDFHLDLGDTFFTESYKAWDAMDDAEAVRRHLEVRPYFERVGAPLFFVLGNHEGEQGWRFAAGDPIAPRSERVRRMLFPNPVDQEPEDVYAFRWGDVLVVVLDPYRYTVHKPHAVGGDPGTGDLWDWTLGKEQADWLALTLAESDAPYELVFAHQLTGGTNDYGRGGRMAVESGADGGTYEWGGKGATAGDDFAARRPGWDKPIHQILADAGVVAFVRGHDHKFIWEPPLDGVAYVTVPQPGDATYGDGYNPPTHPDAVVLPNAGHLKFTSSRGQLEMSYIRSFLPDDGPDGDVAFTHTWTAP
jgi:hypothetical protein